MRTIQSAVITGPTGAIGVALCRLLLEKGVKVYALCRPGSNRANHLPEGVQKLECDLGALGSLPALLSEPVDAFFHFGWAGTTGAGRNDLYVQNENVRCTLDAIHAAKALGCKVFLGAGSQAEYGRVQGTITPETPCFPENGYGMAKLCAGQMGKVECEKLGMGFIWTRILSVYGPYDGEQSMIMSTIRKLLNGEKPSLTEGTQMWDYLYSEDAAEAFLRLAQKGKSGKTYVVAGGSSRPLREYVEMLRDAIDPALSLGFGEVENKNPIALSADITALQEDTGFVPKVDFRTGIRNTICYVRENPL